MCVLICVCVFVHIYTYTLLFLFFILFFHIWFCFTGPYLLANEIAVGRVLALVLIIVGMMYITKAEYIVLVVVVVVVVVVVLAVVLVVVLLVVVLLVLVVVVVVHFAVIAGLWCFFLYNFQVLLFIRGGFDKLRRQFNLWRSWSF